MSDPLIITAKETIGVAPDEPVFGSFASGVAITFASRLLILACAVGSSIIVARWLGPEGTGALAVLNVTVALAMQLGSAGLPSATIYFVARDRSRLAPVWLNGVVFSLAAGVVIAIAVIATGKLRPDIFNSVSARLISIASISIPFQLLTLMGLNLLLAIDKIRLMNALDSLSSLFLVANAFVVLVIWRQQLPVLVWFNTATAVVAGLILILFVARLLRRQHRGDVWRPNFSLLRQMLFYGLKFYISIFAGFCIFRADLLIVNHFRGAPEAGVYAIASQYSFLLIMLPGVIASLLFPRVASRQDETAAYTVEVTRHTSLVMLVVCIAAAGASFVVPIVYGARFGDATIQMLIMLPGVFLISLESVLVQHFTGTGLPAIIPVFWLITMVVNVGLNLATVPAWGGRAAAINSSVSYGLIFIVVAIYFCRRTGRSARETFIPRISELRDVFALLRYAFAK
ncbi:MAG: oligosaccharide flippase family protein [Pyrinomonadaceae bacterium]